MSDGELEVVFEMIQVPSNFELEKQLLQCLEDCKKPIPCRWKDFNIFVQKRFDYNFSREVVRSVWTQLKNLEDHKNGKALETIELSSDDEMKKIKEEYHYPGRNSESPLKKKKKGRALTEEEKCNEKELKKKIRHEVVLDEMLQRDQQMLSICPSENRQDRVEHIEQEFLKRLEKERIDSIVSERFKYLKEHQHSEEEEDIELKEESESEDNEDMRIKKRKSAPSGYQSEKSRTQLLRGKLSPPNGVTQMKRRVTRKRTKEDEAEKLRRNLLIDKLIEISLPEMQPQSKDSDKPNRKKRKRNSV